MKKDRMRKSGFTLTELLIVIVIIGILGSIAVPRFFPQREKALVAEAVNMIGAIRQGELAYQLGHNGDFLDLAAGGNWDEIGIDDPNGNANRRFDYAVVTSDAAGTPPATISATRIPAGLATYGGTTIVLDVASGQWGAGTHPFRPQNI